jgi:hypothetical protein
VTRMQESFRQSLSELRREVSTSSGREAFIPVLRPPTSIIPKDNLFLLANLSPRQSFHTPCKSFLRLRTFRELSLGENFSSATDFSPCALISGRGLLERVQLFSNTIRDFRTHPVLISFPTLVARHRLPVGDSLPRSRSIQGPPDPHLLSCSTWWPEPCSRDARTLQHTDAYTGLRADSYTNTPDFSGKGAP